MAKWITILIIALVAAGAGWKFSNQTSDENDGWKTYDGSDYGVTFSYPSNFQIVTDKIHIEYQGHPQGFNWYRIELTDASLAEKPFMRFEVDPDGYGPFFPDKTYQITESADGKIVIESESDKECSEYSDDGKILIIPNVLKANNGHSYYWQFHFNEGGEDYEPIFKQILSTFQFSDDSPPVPAAAEAVRARAAAEAAVGENLVTLYTVKEREWSDSCLGLGGPAESCLFVITPGWEVTVRVNGERQVYRTNADGSVIRRES